VGYFFILEVVMATPTAQLLSRTLYATDGLTTVWDFAFSGGYLDPSHVKAFTETPAGVRTPIVITEPMLIGEFQLQITPALAAGDELTIYRDTPKDLPLVDFTDEAGFSEISLDTNAKQAVFIAAEAIDTVNALDVATAINAAEAAGISAAAALVSQAAAAVSAASAAADLVATGNDRVTVAADRVAVEDVLSDTLDLYGSAAAIAAAVADTDADRVAAAASASAAADSASTATTQAGIATTQAGLADTARTGAETARTGAETARTGAETAQTNATAQVELAAAQVALATTQANNAADSAAAALAMPTSATLEANKVWVKTGSTGFSLTDGLLPTGSIAFISQNDSNSTSLAQGAGVTLRLAGVGNITGNRFLSAWGFCTVRYISPTVVVVSGDVT
jgi:hypothetical protein